MDELDSQNPYVANPLGSESIGNEPADALTRKALLAPAVGLIVSSVLHIFCGLFFYAFVYVSSLDDPGTWAALMPSCIYYGITMLYSLFIAFGAFNMLRASSYTWAMVVCVLAIVPIFGPCYVLGIPFGVWGIIVLRRRGMAEAFQRLA